MLLIVKKSYNYLLTKKVGVEILGFGKRSYIYPLEESNDSI
jgi:hypothetical protein